MKNADSGFGSRLSRRTFLGGVAASSALLLAGCSNAESGGSSASGGAPSSKPVATGGSAPATDVEKWKQFSGTKLTFITENTPPSTGIKELVDRGDFQKLTGIDVNIQQNDLPVMLQKAELELRSGGASYDLIYLQDKPVTPMLADFMEDLTPYIKDASLPQSPDGYDEKAWLPNYLNVGAYAFTDKLIGLPFDAAVSVFCYRRDLFEKYSNQFEAEYGYALEYGPESTWKNVLDFARFFADLRKKTGSGPYGMGLHLGSFAWTTQLDIQKMLYSHGQWREFDIDDIKGAKEPGPTRWGDEQSIKILQLYKDLFDTSSPDALSIGTVELVNSFAAGEVAMCTEFHEDAAPFEDPKSSKASGGRTAYDVCPKGDKEFLVGDGQLVNGTDCGIASIGINAAASEAQKKAAWLFCVWSTLTQTQRDNLAISGGTPTRTAVLDIDEIKKAEGEPYGTGDTGRVGPSEFPNALTFPAISVGMATPNAVLGPKIPQINEYVTIVANNVQRLCAGKTDAATTAKNIKDEVDAATGAA